jgi:hypothetical protein
MSEKPSQGQLDPSHYDPDPKEIARIDEVERESAGIADEEVRPRKSWEPVSDPRRRGWHDRIVASVVIAER